MAFNAGSLRALLELDTSRFRKGMGDATGRVDKFGGRLGKLSGIFQKLGKVGPILGLVAPIALATAGVAGLTAAVADGVRKQAIYEQAVAGLGNTLRTQGVANFEAFTSSIESFATTLQRTTGVADEEVLDVARSLTVLGTSADQLPQATKVTIDFAKALGLNVNTAARAFGQALAGNASTLARYVPSVRELTKEQLAAGKAFEFAGKAVEGQSEALGNTFQGRIDRLVASFDDLKKRLGAAITESFGPLITEVQGALDVLTDRLEGGSSSFEALKAAAGGAAEFIKRSLEVAARVGIQLRTTYLGISAAVRTSFASINAIVAELDARINEFVASAFSGLAGLLERIAVFVERIPGIGDSAAAALRGMAVNAREVQVNATASAAAIRENSEEALASAAALRLAATQSAVMGAALDGAQAAGASLATQTGIVAKGLGLAAQEGNKLAQAELTGEAAARKQVAALNARLEKLRGITGITASLVSSDTKAADELQRAANNASQLKSNLDGAAASAGRVASAVSSAGGGGGGSGGGGITGLGSRGVIGTSSLDFSDPFAAVAQLRNAVGAQRRVQQGIGNALLGGFPESAAAAFTEGVRGTAEAAVQRALGAFSAQVIQELNAAGVLDPATRSRTIAERIAEAKRFGILPSGISSTGRITSEGIGSL